MKREIVAGELLAKEELIEKMDERGGKICLKCRYWEGSSDPDTMEGTPRRGECRYNPPTYVGTWVMAPVTAANYWCGKFENREK